MQRMRVGSTLASRSTFSFPQIPHISGYSVRSGVSCEKRTGRQKTFRLFVSLWKHQRGEMFTRGEQFPSASWTLDLLPVRQDGPDRLAYSTGWKLDIAQGGLWWPD